MSGMDVLRERIADTVRAHRPGASIDAYTCDCGVPWTSEHVADAVIAALGLMEQREQGCTVAFNDDEPALHWAPRRRYVTPWERTEEDG